MTLLNATLTRRLRGPLDRASTQEAAYMRVLSPSDLKQVLRLQSEVYAQMPNKHLLVVDSEAELASALNGDGFILGVQTAKDDALVAYRYVRYVSANDPEHLGLDLGQDHHARSRSVHLETTLVRPDFRGNHLQRLTLQLAEKQVRSEGFAHLLCTVSPFNTHSLYNVMSEGLFIKCLRQKYGARLDRKQGLWRFILCKDLLAVADYNTRSSALLPVSDLTLQRFLLKRGYAGVGISEACTHIAYAPLEMT